jgi:putative phage-type endonuclease
MTITAEDTIAEHAEVVCRTDDLPREEWLVLRKLYIGGSEAAASIGLSPYESPTSLFITKTSEEVTDEDNDYMRWGRRLEEAIGYGIAEDTDIPVVRHPYMMRSKQWPWMAVNVDFLSHATMDYPPSVVEVKNVSAHLSREWEDGAVPAHYGLQGQHACAVLGLPGVHFFPLIGGNEGRPVYVERNDRLIEQLVEGERQFWDLVQQDLMPDPDASTATRDALRKQYRLTGDDFGAAREIPREAVHLLRERRDAKRVIAEQQEYIQEIENRLMQWLGKAEIGKVGGVTVVTWKQQSRKAHLVADSTFRMFHVPRDSPVNQEDT